MPKKKDREITWESDQEPIYEVGYKKPPQHSRFKPGRSGNPKGRPKKVDVTLDDIFHRLLNSPMKVSGPTGVKTMSMAEVLIRKQLQQAAAGNIKAFQFFAKNIPLVGKGQEVIPATNFVLTSHNDVKHQAKIKDLIEKLKKYEDVEPYDQSDYLKLIGEDDKKMTR